MSRIVVFLFLLICGAVSSCRRLPDVQGNGETWLQGVWGQDSLPNADKLLSYSLHQFKFSCDSFYVDLVTRSKVNYYEETCYNNGIWKEYAKGTYVLRNDTLFLRGTYTKANYKQKISGCYAIGQYIKNFVVLSKGAEKINLESTENQNEISLGLKQKIVCVPKAL